jgi:chromosomal replication initiation ATPase DnaA
MIYLIKREDYYIRSNRLPANFKDDNTLEIRNILRKVAIISGYHTAKLTGKSRVNDLVEWRMLISYICKMNGYGTLKAVGVELGGLHHSSIINHVERTQNMIDCDDKYFMRKFNKVKHLIK